MSDWEFKTIMATKVTEEFVEAETGKYALVGRAREGFNDLKSGKMRVGIDADGAIAWASNDVAYKKTSKAQTNSTPSPQAKPVTDMYDKRQSLIVKQSCLNRAVDLVISNTVPVKLNETAANTAKTLAEEFYSFITGEVWN
jgi:hypothetical protein